MIENLKAVAIKEVEEQSFELTKQYLSVNKLVYINDTPKIDDVIINDEDQSAAVYFPIKDEAYYFVIYLDIFPEVSLKLMGMSAGNRVYLNVSSEGIELEKLLKEININPTFVWRKGTKIPNRKITSFYNDSGFIFEYQSKKTGEVEDKLSNLLEILDSSNFLPTIKSELIHRVIQIDYYGYKDEMWGINLKPTCIEKISKLNAYLDIDLYASGPDLE